MLDFDALTSAAAHRSDLGTSEARHRGYLLRVPRNELGGKVARWPTGLGGTEGADQAS